MAVNFALDDVIIGKFGILPLMTSFWSKLSLPSTGGALLSSDDFDAPPVCLTPMYHTVSTSSRPLQDFTYFRTFLLPRKIISVIVYPYEKSAISRLFSF